MHSGADGTLPIICDAAALGPPLHIEDADCVGTASNNREVVSSFAVGAKSDEPFNHQQTGFTGEAAQPNPPTKLSTSQGLDESKLQPDITDQRVALARESPPLVPEAAGAQKVV